MHYSRISADSHIDLPWMPNAESGIGWIPYVLDRMDFEWEDRFRDLGLTMKPSEYWRRQCYYANSASLRRKDVLFQAWAHYLAFYKKRTLSTDCYELYHHHFGG